MYNQVNLALPQKKRIVPLWHFRFNKSIELDKLAIHEKSTIRFIDYSDFCI